MGLLILNQKISNQPDLFQTLRCQAFNSEFGHHNKTCAHYLGIIGSLVDKVDKLITLSMASASNNTLFVRIGL